MLLLCCVSLSPNRIRCGDQSIGMIVRRQLLLQYDDRFSGGNFCLLGLLERRSISGDTFLTLFNLFLKFSDALLRDIDFSLLESNLLLCGDLGLLCRIQLLLNSLCPGVISADNQPGADGEEEGESKSS